MLPNFASTIQKQLQNPLPGIPAQLKMANTFRKTQPDDPEKVQVASTLLLLYQKGEDWYFPLIQRTSNNPNDRHSGQIAFPGGKREEADLDLEMTALREAEEEVGVSSEDITILGRLTELYIPVSNFMVHPFVGYLSYAPSFILQQSEVVEVLEISLADLQNPKNRKRKEITLSQGIRLKDVPYFYIQDKTIWGATAMMLSEFLEVIDTI
ncbi:MAG: CoA pyrophosphatase [Bacteroidota bacterium]